MPGGSTSFLNLRCFKSLFLKNAHVKWRESYNRINCRMFVLENESGRIQQCSEIKEKNLIKIVNGKILIKQNCTSRAFVGSHYNRADSGVAMGRYWGAAANALPNLW